VSGGRRQVVVTGMGVVSPIGCTIEEFRHNLLAGVSGVGPITLFDPASLPTRIAAEVKLPDDRQPFRDRKIGFALLAAERAMEAASACGTRPGGNDGGLGAGVSIGMGLELFSMPDMIAVRQPGFVMPEALADRLTFLQTPSELCVHLVSHEHGLRTPPLVHVSACAAGADAIGAAYRLVASGRRRWMLAGGADSMVNPMGVGGFCALRAMSTRNAEPARASRPFDRGRDGFVLGEGAGFLVLEELEGAVARGARIHAELCGYGSAFDAHGISEPHPEGLGAYLAMRRALEAAGLSPAEVDCINAHGTSTPKNDQVETLAIKRLLGDRAREVPVCATKSMIGHLVAAAGAVEALAAVLCLEAGWVHPTLNLEDPDPWCDLDYVPGQARRYLQDVVLSNSFGFGGQNASLVFRRAERS
jgi:3-oxoacyl-[acyl-carrier-protein] synthase II